MSVGSSLVKHMGDPVTLFVVHGNPAGGRVRERQGRIRKRRGREGWRDKKGGDGTGVGSGTGDVMKANQ